MALLWIGSRPRHIVWITIDLLLPPKPLAPSVTAFARNGGSQRKRSASSLRGNLSPKSAHLILSKPRGVCSRSFRERKYTYCGSGRGGWVGGSGKTVVCFL